MATGHELAVLARRAADIIIERGFTKERLVDVNGVCHNGALLLAAGVCLNPALLMTDIHTEAIVSSQQAEMICLVNDACKDILERDGFGHLMKELHGDQSWVHVWNDQPGTTAEDVILLLKRAAAELEQF